jgi:hypothetical protein
MNPPPVGGWRRRLALGLAFLAPAAVGVALLGAAGFEFTPASSDGQLAAAGLALAALAWAVPALWRPPARALAGQLHASPARRRRWPLPLNAALAVAAACALLLWLQPAPPEAPAAADTPAVVLRADPLRADTPGGAGPRLTVAGADADGPAGWQAADGRGATWRDDRDRGAEVAWVGVHGRAWPVATPPTAVVVAPGVPPDRLGALRRRLGRTTVGDDADGFPLAEAVAADPPRPALVGPAFQPDGQAAKSDSRRRVSGLGAKALGPDSFALAGAAPPAYFWTALPDRDEVRPLRPVGPDAPDAFALSVNPPSPGPRLDPNQQVYGMKYAAPVFGVAYRDGLPVYTLAPAKAPAGAGFDALGETGLGQAADALDGAVATWRSRRHAAAAGFVVPRGDLRAPAAPWWKAAAVRALPGGRNGAEAERRKSIRIVLGCAAAACALLGLFRLGGRQ